jgi:cytoskeletal protein RodZ
MRKSLCAVLLLTVLILSGCSVEQAGPQDIEKPTTAISSEEREQLTETETIPSEQVKTESSVDIDDSEKSEAEIPVQNTEVNSGDSENKSSSEQVKEPSVTSEQNKSSEQKAPDITPTVEEKSKEVTTEETTQTESNESETESPAPFDIDYWISYAKTTAQQNGLSLDSTATDCWDNPITANPDCIYLERDISSRMSRYARDGFTCVWVWYECVVTDSYLIYVGYA